MTTGRQVRSPAQSSNCYTLLDRPAPTWGLAPRTRSRGDALARLQKQAAIDVDPVAVGLQHVLGVQKLHPEVALLGLQARRLRGNLRVRRQILRLLDDPLAVLREDEVQEQHRGVRMRGILWQRKRVECG